MSDSRGLVLSIAGAPFSLSTHTGLTGAAGFAQNTRAEIINVPAGQTLSIDPASGSFDAGGLSIQCRDLSALLTQNVSDPTTRLAAEQSAVSTSWSVEDTTGFTAGDTIHIGSEAVLIGGVTPGAPGAFTGLTRGILGTVATRHAPNKKIYGFFPNLEGRRVVCEWIDLVTGDRFLRYVGEIERIEFTGSEYSIAITSVLVGVNDRKVLRKQYAQGRLLEALPENGIVPDLLIQCDDKSRIFVDNSNTGHDTAHILIGNEIIETPQVFNPAEIANVANTVSTYRLEIESTTLIQPGFMVDFIDASGDLVLEGALIVAITSATPATDYYDFNTDVSGVSTADRLAANYHCLIPASRIKRGSSGTKAEKHEAGATVDEIRILEGNQIDILLRLLFSDQGDFSNGPSSGAYDYYPPNWGLALDSSFVDLQALLDLKAERSDFRRYRQQETIELSEMLRLIGIYCNAAVFWKESGALTATLRSDFYPLDPAATPITESNRDANTNPSATLDRSLVRNFWEVKTDWSLGRDRFEHVITLEEIDSSDLRGQIAIEAADDYGLIKSVSEAQIYTSARSFLLVRSAPLLIVSVSIFLDETSNLRPGQLALLQLPELPDLAGGAGIFSTFEILEVSPVDNAGLVGLTLMERVSDRKAGYVAPAAIVSSVAAGIVTLEPASTSHFAPAAPAFEPPGGAGQTGTEDLHWFLQNDPIRFWDVSTFGSGTATTQATTITAINYAALQITPAVVPAWLGAGDLIRFDNYTSTAGGATGAERINYFLAIADGTTDPPVLDNGVDNDPSWVWGM